MSIQKSQFITAAVLLFGSQLLHAQLNDFVPLSDDALNNPDAADWLRWRGNHSANGYSSLDQLTPENAHKLRLAWAWNMESGESEQEPLVYDGIMFLPHTNGKVQALDATDGEHTAVGFASSIPRHTRRIRTAKCRRPGEEQHNLPAKR